VTAERKQRGLLGYIGVGLSAAVLVAVLALAAVLIVVPRIAGATPLTVLTNSMAPGLPPGTLLYVLPVEADEVHIGDVVTYQIRSDDPALITHRVTGITPSSDGETTFTFQGDDNGSADEPVVPGQIKARLWYAVPFAGFVNTTVNGENRAWIAPLVAGAFLAYSLFMITGGIVSSVRRRRARRAPLTITPAKDTP
jgi:signal peptidase